MSRANDLREFCLDIIRDDAMIRHAELSDEKLANKAMEILVRNPEIFDPGAMLLRGLCQRILKVPVEEHNPLYDEPVTKKQIGYISGLCKKACLNRHQLPLNISEIADSDDLSEGAAIEVIDKLIKLLGEDK